MEAGIRTVADFLLALPFRYEDRRRYASVASLEWERPTTVLVHFQGVRSTRMRRGLLRVEAVADDGTGAVRVVWHNRYPSFAKALAAEGRRAAELLPVRKDSINGALVAEYLAVTYAWTGEKDAAIEQLSTVVKVPGDVSYGQLRLHPFWDSLRDDPRFEQIVASLAPVEVPR